MHPAYTGIPSVVETNRDKDSSCTQSAHRHRNFQTCLQYHMYQTKLGLVICNYSQVPSKQSLIPRVFWIMYLLIRIM
jgi:hypothetical protein